MAFDLDAVLNEASGERFSFTLGGKEYTMVSPEDLDYRDAEKLENANPNDVLEFLLGTAEFKSFQKNRVTVKAIGKLLEQWGEFYGISLGNGSES